jgi:aspartate kinase
MEVIKIGGAVLGKKGGFESMLNIIENHSAKPLLIVISAFASETRQLENAARLAESGNEEEAKKTISVIIKELINFSDNLITNKSHLSNLNSIFRKGEKEILNYIRGLSITKELTPRTLDAILSHGEYFALHTVKQYLIEKGLNHECIDSTSLIVSDSNFGNANPLIPETEKNIEKILKPALEKYSIVLTQGFVAKNILGDITTMGIESSNLTATLYAELLGTKKLTIWTDVNGFRTTDPKLIANAKPIKEMNYHDAYIASVNGLKLLYPAMVEHASDKNIKLIYRSAFEPDKNHTVVHRVAKPITQPQIILKENLVFIRINLESAKAKEEIEFYIMNNKELKNSLFAYSINRDSCQVIAPMFISNKIKPPDSSGTIIIEPCCVITILHPEKDIEYIIKNENIKKYQNSILNINLNYSGNISRLVVKQGTESEIIKIMYHTLFS